MSTSPPPPPLPSSTGDSLQFESAEFERPVTSADTCRRCGGSLGEAYYQVDNVVACEVCAEKRTREWESGSFVGRLIGGIGFGWIGALLGFALYFGVMVVSGLEIGLIAIVTGFMVGMGVKMGTDGRGGRIFQVISVLLTYAAIALSYAAVMEREMHKSVRETAANGLSSDGESGSTDQLRAKILAPLAAEMLARYESRPWPLRVADFFSDAAAMPFLNPDIMGTIIIAIALYQAWKVARPAGAPVSGPFLRQGDAAVAMETQPLPPVPRVSVDEPRL